MNYPLKHFAAFLVVSLAPLAVAQSNFGRTPEVPANLRVPEGNTAYLKTSATGTQNYVCLPGANGPEWRFLGPQATVYIAFPWFGGEAYWQTATHFLSANPDEGGTARPAWQNSSDSSIVWGRAVASSTDPDYVASGAIPWLLVQIAGTRKGPTGGAAITPTTFIQRVNTAGGVAPGSGCDESSFGKVALVPYTTDYWFYKASRN